MRIFIALCVVIVTSAAYAEDPADAFPKFCEEWMQKLAAREQHNVSHIDWQTGQSGVTGAYVGYDQHHTCVTKTGTQNVQIGKITYREVKFEKQGPTVDVAEHSAARPVETTEVTEIFRYAGGKWIY